MYQLLKWGVCVSCRNGGMCCGNVGYVLQKWGDVAVAEMGGVSMFCRNGEYNYTSSRYVSGEIM